MTVDTKSAQTAEETCKKSEDGTPITRNESERLSQMLEIDCEIIDLSWNKQVRIGKEIYLVPKNFTVEDIMSFIKSVR